MARVRPSHLRNSILYTSLFVIVGLLAIMLPLSYSLAAGILRHSSITYAGQLLVQVNNSIGYYVGEMTDVSDFIVQDPDVVRYLSNVSAASEQAVSDKLQTIFAIRPDFVNLMILRPDGSFISSRSGIALNQAWDFTTFDWYKRTVGAAGQPVLSSSRVENIVAGEYPWVVTLSRALYVGQEFKGILMIDLNYQQISDICSNISNQNSGYVFIVGDDNRLVYHPQQKLIYSGIKTERFDLVFHSQEPSSVISDGYIYTSIMLENTGWNLVSVLNTNKLVTIGPAYLAIYAAAGLFFAIIAIIVSIVASKKLTDPILELKASMRRFEQGDFDAKADLHVNNEIAELGSRFNVMTERIKKLIEESLLIEEQKRRSEIQALQSQIRPHFLYNTLESIIWMAEMGDNDKIIDMTSSLSKLMRASANDAGDLISLQTEIDYVANYLKIQKMRYLEKLTYRIEIDPALLQARVLRLIIQPLAENALYHGIKQMKQNGTILISAASGAYRGPGREDGSQPERPCLLIHVCDNGVGFQKQIDFQAKSDQESEDGGIGLINVNNRIKLYFGSEYGVIISSNHLHDGGGVYDDADMPDGMHTCVTIILPLIFE
ncbi:MAG: sensor histidine kinase [Clostridiaceae bacterium]|nr:sensor histidine kinase [Clostridiaceae bacterium]